VLGKSKSTAAPRPVDEGLIAKAMAKAVADGDIVNFRFLFISAFLARLGGSERFETMKYAYLLPDDDQERDSRYEEALAATKEPLTWDHIKSELTAERPPQVPSQLVLQLADNAVLLGKYTSASQAYELLRIRAQMQETYFEQADEALEAGDVPTAVRGYIIATSLDYDYAAFPEPLPKEPDFQTRALMLHGDYPERPEDSLPLLETDLFLGKALGYLLLNGEAAARLESRPVEIRVAFLKELVTQGDPEWTQFTERYREACAIRERFDKRIQRAISDLIEEGSRGVLLDEIEDALGEDPRLMATALLGRTIPDGEWWQYLKDLAYKHPASSLLNTTPSGRKMSCMSWLWSRVRPDSCS
jgi:hypothetical protein